MSKNRNTTRNNQKNKKKFVTNDQSLDLYLHEIGKTSLLSKEQEVELSDWAKEGDIQARNLLITANLRFVVSVAKRYQGQGMSLADLINEGNLGLVKASKRFDPSLGFRFISYAVWWIRQSILVSLAENSRIVRLPMNRVSSVFRMGKVTKTLEQKLGRLPSSEEIANFSDDFSEKEIRNNQSIKNSHLSIDAPLLSNDEGNTNSLADILEDEETPSPDAQMYSDELKIIIDKLLDSLTPREAEVIVLYMGLKGQKSLTLEEIGARLSLTRERIRQIKEKAIRRLQHNSRARYLLEFYHG